MANQIRITPDQMRTRAGEYRDQAGVVGEVISKMDQLLEALQSEWEGAASESYAVRFSELRPGFVQAQELINEIAAALDSTAQILEETDIDIVCQFRS
ncbi:MAG: WXG100 family type VII secretion target [Lachnospiraceae bacterium]|nr:WXG100 family type VII secretion target [Lachnospiraceae bacterium]